MDKYKFLDYKNCVKFYYYIITIISIIIITTNFIFFPVGVC